MGELLYGRPGPALGFGVMAIAAGLAMRAVLQRFERVFEL
jgi:hypothetical protein